MGITPSPACTQKRGPEPRLLHSLSLCAQGIPFQEEKICTLSRLTEDKGGAVGLVLVPPSNNCIASALGEGGVDFRRHRSWGKELQALESAERRTNSWVLVLEFSQAPQAPSACLRPWTLVPSCPAACVPAHRYFTTGFGFAGLKTTIGLRAH